MVSRRGKRRIVRVATLQYLMRRLHRFEEFEEQVASLVRTAADDYECDLVVFPEYFTAQLLTLEPSHDDIAEQVRRLAEHTPRFVSFMADLARKYEIHIVAGTTPELEDGRVYNHSYLFDPQGKHAVQGKLHMTRFEHEEWHVSARKKLKIFETAIGRLAIAICYDVEFPELARAAARAGVQILVVPSCTDDRKGYLRVRYCAQARAIENQFYVVLSHTVGSIPMVPTVALNYGQAAILTPSDVMFSRDGILAEGNVNEENVVIGEVDLDLIDRARTFGTVLPLRDSENTARLTRSPEVVSLLPTKGRPSEILVRHTTPSDFPGIRALGEVVYPHDAGYTDDYLQRQLDAFPEGQFVAVEIDTQRVVGMASTLIVSWEDYEFSASWTEITGGGYLTTHDPTGRTLYAADVMVHPDFQGRGVGRQIYAVRRELATRLKMIRIRAGARLAGYQAYAGRMSPEDYTLKVVNGELRDPTLSFQLARGFHVIGVVRDYLDDDPESQNHAAFIEWINHRVAKPKHYRARDPRFRRNVPKPPPEVKKRGD